MTIGSILKPNGKHVVLLWYGYRGPLGVEPYVKKRVVLTTAMYEELVEKIESFKDDPK